MKPRILIAMHYMELGGAESALLGLLLAHDPKRADIDLFLYDHRGELMKYIPDTVNLLPEIPAYTMLERPIVELVKKGFWGIAAGRLLAKMKAKQDAKNNTEGRDNISVYHFIANYVQSFLPKINAGVEYDLAISFLLPHQYVLIKVNAQKKMAWLHTDYSRVYVSTKELNIWGVYEYIAAISEDVAKGFAGVFPNLKKKIIPIENILSSSFIRQRALELCQGIRIIQSEEERFTLKLLTIGRYSYQKKLDEVPAIARRIVDAGIYIKWYIIGYGLQSAEDEIRANIEKEGMMEHVILLGKQINPYPFIKSCDVYVQPSRYEGKSITVREAQILRKPVIVTNYPTAPSQIQDGVDGIIVPLEIDNCAKCMVDFLRDDNLQKSIVGYLESHDYGNESEIEKIYQLC